MILKFSVLHIHELFTESKKLGVSSHSGAITLATTRTFSGQSFAFFCPENSFVLARDHFCNLIFGLVVSFHEQYKPYLEAIVILDFCLFF